MSGQFLGITFPWQKVTPSDDGAVRKAALTDGVLFGCSLAHSGATLTMQAGQCMVGGRQIRHAAAENWAITGATTGFARLLLTVDLTGAATEASFDQVRTSIEYSGTVDGFPALTQENINDDGTTYQIPVCVVSLGVSGITGVVSRWANSVPVLRLIEGETFGYELPEDPVDGQFFVLIVE